MEILVSMTYNVHVQTMIIAFLMRHMSILSARTSFVPVPKVIITRPIKMPALKVQKVNKVTEQ